MDLSSLVRNRSAQAIAAGLIAAGLGGAGYWYYTHKKRQSTVVIDDSSQMEINFDAPRPIPVIFDERLPSRILQQDREDDQVDIDDQIEVEDDQVDIDDQIEVEDEEESQDDGVLERPLEITGPDWGIDLIEEEDSPEIKSVFADNGPGWDYEKEQANRENKTVYILHQDEFYRDTFGFAQATLMWYVGDQILSDESNRPIYNHNEVVGELIFGHGSSDSDVVYVRNEKLKAEYQILKDEGHYAEVILGLEADAEIASDMMHSDRTQKFRPSD